MFGADTPLVIEAIQLAILAIGAGAGGAWLLLRRRASRNSRTIHDNQSGSLEDRVRVLERIATDRSIDLANEIENLRDTRTETD